MAKAGRRRIHKQISDHFGSEDFCGKYKFVKQLGKGSYGYVCLATDINNSKLKYAVKKVERVFANRTEAKRMLRELRILRVLKDCPEIVKLVDLLPPPDLQSFDSLMVVFEFVDTDLSRLFASNQHFTAKHTPYILYQILLGLNYMHSAKICHRDLKPANILIKEDCSIRICDFGLARSLELNTDDMPHPMSHGTVIQNAVLPEKRTLKRELTRHVVTRWYRAPEVILLDQDFEHMDRVDMWSVGCIFAELLMMEKENCSHYRDREPLFPGSCSYPLSPASSRRQRAGTAADDQLKVIFDVIGTPTKQEIESFENKNVRKYLNKFFKRKHIDWSKKFKGSSKRALDLLEGLLKFDREERYTCHQSLAHDFLKANRNKAREKEIAPSAFEFEDINLTKDQIREMIVDEVLLYNPVLANKYGLKRTPSDLHLQAVDKSPEERAKELAAIKEAQKKRADDRFYGHGDQAPPEEEKKEAVTK